LPAFDLRGNRAKQVKLLQNHNKVPSPLAGEG
jgi:hypothetical protein